MHDAPFLHVVEFSTQNIWSLIVYLGKRLLHVFLLFHLQIMFLADTGCENYNGLNFEGCVLSPSWFCRHNACLPCLFLFSLAMLLFVGEIYTRLIKLMGWKSLAVGIVSCVHLEPVCLFHMLNVLVTYCRSLYVLYIMYKPPLSRMVYIRCS